MTLLRVFRFPSENPSWGLINKPTYRLRFIPDGNESADSTSKANQERTDQAERQPTDSNNNSFIWPGPRLEA
jgi:hypothetical protein